MAKPPKLPLKVEYRSTASIKPDPRNVKKHSKAQIELIRKSIREFGFTNPILLKASGVIGAGHARFEAAQLEEIDRVPTITLKHLTPRQWRAYMIADNKLAETGSSWDKALLGEELTALKAFDIDVMSLGFSKDELATLNVAGFQLQDGGKADSNTLDGLQYSVIIRCKDEKHQTDLLARFEKEGLTTEAMIS